MKGENLLKEIDHFYETTDVLVDGEIDEEIDAMFDVVFDYRINHDLCFCFRGNDVNNFIVGLDKNCKLQFSFCENSEYFTVKIDDFVVRL